MVGGTVIETLIVTADNTRPERVWVNVQDVPRTETCAVYVEATAQARCISEGDGVWWQSGYVYWTPKQNRISSAESQRRGHKAGKHHDIRIPRIGYSGVNRPHASSTQG